MRAWVFLIWIVAGVAQAAGGTADVRIRDYRFSPDRLTVERGTTVRWTNDEKRASHSVVFPGEKLESERLLSGESWQRRFDRPGIYPYTCEPHPEMKGTIEVAP